jgi:hypothetical protein
VVITEEVHLVDGVAPVVVEDSEDSAAAAVSLVVVLAGAGNLLVLY